jgi:hypothetical protein
MDGRALLRGRELLRAAYEIHIERGGSRDLSVGTALDMAASAERVGVITGTPPYDTAVEQLVRQEAIEPNPTTERTLGGTQYIVTARGRAMLGL